MERTFRIALALKAPHIAPSRDLFLGAHTYAHSQPHWQVLTHQRTTMLSWEEALGLKPDGILGVISEGDHLPALSPDLPEIVVLNNFPTPYQHVVADGEGAGCLAARYLLGRKLQHMAFVGYAQQYFSKQRRFGFLNELRRQGHVGPVPELEFTDLNNPFPHAPEWLRALPKPCGVLCANDRVGRDIINAAQDAGLSVPDEIAVLGISNDRLICLESAVILSSVEQNYEKVGIRGASVLDELLTGQRKKGAPVLIPSGEVVSRESTRMFGVDDPLVRRALLIIHQEHQEPLTIEQLISRLGLVSRRTLTLHFHQVLKRSPYQEILRARIHQAEKLLRGTQLPLEEIATRAGFYDTSQFSRHFRKFTGTSPAAWRRAAWRA